MSAYRWMGCLGLLLAGVVHADPRPGSIEERLDGCEGLPERGSMARYEPVGQNALYGVARSGERYLVFPQQEGRDCEVYPIGRAAARVKGSFGRGSEVCALQPPSCAGGSCFVALVVRGKQERPLAALRTDASCNESVALRPIKLFPGRDSVELVCHASSGAGWKERRVLVDVTGAALAALYSLNTGSYIAVSPEEKKAGDCPSRPVGSIRVEKVAEKPLLRVIDPASGALQDGKGTLPARQLGYDPKRRAFAPTGAPDVPTQVDARADCRR
jgi:hypothetical protein